MAVEQCVVLLREIEERRRDRERDHDGIDALGPDRDRADDGGGDSGEETANGTSTHQGQPKPWTWMLLVPKIAIV